MNSTVNRMAELAFELVSVLKSKWQLKAIQGKCASSEYLKSGGEGHGFLD